VDNLPGSRTPATADRLSPAYQIAHREKAKWRGQLRKPPQQYAAPHDFRFPDWRWPPYPADSWTLLHRAQHLHGEAAPHRYNPVFDAGITAFSLSASTTLF